MVYCLSSKYVLAALPNSLNVSQSKDFTAVYEQMIGGSVVRFLLFKLPF
jgi:hypothetical protein